MLFHKSQSNVGKELSRRTMLIWIEVASKAPFVNTEKDAPMQVMKKSMWWNGSWRNKYF